MFIAQSDWLLCLGISYTIHLRAKQDGSRFVSVMEDKNYFNKRNRRAKQYQKTKDTVSGIKVFRDLYLLAFS